MNLNSYDYIVNADTHTNVLPRDWASYDKDYWLRVWQEQHCSLNSRFWCESYKYCNRCPYA